MTPTQLKNRNEKLMQDKQSGRYTVMELAIKWNITPARIYQIVKEYEQTLDK